MNNSGLNSKVHSVNPKKIYSKCFFIFIIPSTTIKPEHQLEKTTEDPLVTIT